MAALFIWQAIEGGGAFCYACRPPPVLFPSRLFSLRSIGEFHDINY